MISSSRSATCPPRNNPMRTLPACVPRIGYRPTLAMPPYEVSPPAFVQPEAPLPALLQSGHSNRCFGNSGVPPASGSTSLSRIIGLLCPNAVTQTHRPQAAPLWISTPVNLRLKWRPCGCFLSRQVTSWVTIQQTKLRRQGGSGPFWGHPEPEPSFPNDGVRLAHPER